MEIVPNFIRIALFFTQFGVILAGCDRKNPPSSLPATSASSASQPSLTVPPSDSANKQRATPVAQESIESVRTASSQATGDPEPNIDNLHEVTRRNIVRAREELAAAPASSWIPAKLGMMYLTNNLEKDAIPLLERSLEIMPNQSGVQYLLGIALASQKEEARAAASFRKAIELEPDSIFPRMRLATLLLNSDPEAAARELEGVRELKSATAFTHVQIAEAFESLGQTDAAIASCQKAIELEPKCSIAHNTLGTLLAKQGDEKGALQHRKLALTGRECNPPVDRVLLQATAYGHPIRAGISRAMAVAELGKFDEADKLLESLAREDPRSMEVLLAQARLQKAKGAFDLAIDQFNDALAMDSENVQARFELGRLLLSLEKYAEAEKVLSKPPEDKPEAAALLPLKGRLYAMTSRLDQSMAAYRRWVELQKGAPHAVLEFARTLIEVRQLEEAMQLVDPLAKVESDAPIAFALRGKIRFLQNDFSGAEADLRAAIAAGAASSEVYLALTEVFASRKQFDKAIAVLREGLAALEGDPAVMNALAWYLATLPQQELRNGKEARELATLACAETHFTYHAYLDTLGAACAEVGQFEEAVKFARMAIGLVRQTGQKKLVDEYAHRLSLYGMGKPYRMP